MIADIKRPRFDTIPLADGLKWTGGHGWRFEEKMDGVWAIKKAHGGLLVGEQMYPYFYAFDILAVNSTDMRDWPLRERLDVLSDFFNGFDQCSCDICSSLLRPRCGTGGEFLEAVLAQGGEGVVAKRLDEPFGATWYKCKRIETFDLIVTEKHDSKASIHLMTTGCEDRGWCHCRAAFDRINVGDIVEVAAYGLHPSGKLREPRFVRLRRDKLTPHDAGHSPR